MFNTFNWLNSVFFPAHQFVFSITRFDQHRFIQLVHIDGFACLYLSLYMCTICVHCTCRFVWIALKLYLCANNVNKWMDLVSQTNVKHKNMLTHTNANTLAFTSTELSKCIIMHVANATCFMPTAVCAFPSNEFAIFYTWCQLPSFWRERERKKNQFYQFRMMRMIVCCDRLIKSLLPCLIYVNVLSCSKKNVSFWKIFIYFVASKTAHFNIDCSWYEKNNGICCSFLDRHTAKVKCLWQKCCLNS